MLWARTGTAIDVRRGLQALLDPQVRRIAIANPAHAPYGRAAVAALQHEGLHERVRSKLVLGENISQAAQFVESGNAEAGIIALSLAMATPLREAGTYFEIPHRVLPAARTGGRRSQEVSQPCGGTPVRRVSETPRVDAAAAGARFCGAVAATFTMTAIDWPAILLSVRLAAVVAAMLLVIGLPIAHWIAFSRWRWKFLVEAVVALPLVLPPTVLGFYVLVAIGARSPIGTRMDRVDRSRPRVHLRGARPRVDSLQPALHGAADRRGVLAGGSDARRGFVDPRRVAVADVLFGSSCRFSLEGVIAGTVLTFAHTLGEFGVVLMVGGNLPGVTRTVSIAIYDQVQALHYEAANQTALLLLVFSFVVLAAVYALRGKPWTT